MPSRRSFIGSLVALAVVPFAPKAQTLRVGDVFTVSGVNAINPVMRDTVTGISIRFIRQWNVDEDTCRVWPMMIPCRLREELRA